MKHFMKFYRNLPVFLIAIVLSSSFLISCDKDDDNDTEELPTLSQEEKDMILKMREEEKLARDVYQFLYDKYPSLTIFANITSSEQVHMDRVLTLIEKYSLTDPALPNPGEFSDEELQNLYDQLTAAGEVSEVEALKVGATIEDLDIFDLEDCMSRTDNPDILNVFENLDCGSRNHMRAFISNLSLLNETYTPQFISPEEFEAIISTPRERCNF